MPPLLLPAVEQSADTPREFGQQPGPLRLAAGAEVEAEAHPVEFHPVEIVPFREFFDQAEVIRPDLLPSVVEGTVGPGGESVRHAAELRMLAPELAVNIAAFIVHVVDVVHPHRKPGRDAVRPGTGDPTGVDVDAGPVQGPGGVNPLARGDPAFRCQAGQQRLIVRPVRIVAAPDRIPHPAAIAGSHAVRAEQQVRDSRPGVLIDERVHGRLGQRRAGASEEEVAVVFVECDPDHTRASAGLPSPARSGICQRDHGSEHLPSPGTFWQHNPISQFSVVRRCGRRGREWRCGPCRSTSSRAGRPGCSSPAVRSRRADSWPTRCRTCGPPRWATGR